MMIPEDAKATIEHVPQNTGRDGAVDFVAKMHELGVFSHSAATELYCSSNGDRWYLVRDAGRPKNDCQENNYVEFCGVRISSSARLAYLVETSTTRDSLISCILSCGVKSR